MSGKPPKQPDTGPEKPKIKVLLVDDVAETRESIKKVLSFEQDFVVVGTASNGREGVANAKELKPDIVLMDINMPDMDGLEAAEKITKVNPTIGVVMMSVQYDQDYIQRAMLAGARYFLPKPVNMDQLYNTIRTVYEQYGAIRRQFEAMANATYAAPVIEDEEKAGGTRAGHIIVVYSPQGGSGKTTIATSLASGLMRDGVKTLLVDGNLQFGDCGAFLDLRSQSTLMEVVEHANDLDFEYFDSIVATHNSGLKVLLCPPRPMMGYALSNDQPTVLAEIIKQIANFYDFVVVDTSALIDPIASALLEIASKIVVVTLPTLPAIKNARLAIDFLEQTHFGTKLSIVLNRVPDNPARTQKTMPTPEKIQAYLKRPIDAIIPQVDEHIILAAINRGVPVIASERDTSKPPIRQLLKLAEHLYNDLMGIKESEPEQQESANKKSSWNIFGNR